MGEVIPKYHTDSNVLKANKIYKNRKDEYLSNFYDSEGNIKWGGS